MPKKKYTDEFIQQLREEYDAGDSTTIIGQRYGLNPGQISSLLKKSGYTARPCLRHTIDFEVIAKLKAEGKTNKEIAALLGVKLLTLKDWKLSQFDGPLKDKFGPKHNKKDLGFFENVDSEVKAYILGWLTADGNVTDKGQVRIELGSEDKYIVEFIRDHLSPTSSVKDYSRILSNGRQLNTAVFSCTCAKWKRDLQKYGVIPNKSASSEPMPVLEENLMRHYIRGFFEGNGSATLNPAGTFYILTFVYGNSVFIEGLCVYLNKIGIKARVRKRKSNCSDVCVCRKEDAFKLVNYMYNGASVYLERKLTKVSSMLLPLNSVNCWEAA